MTSARRATAEVDRFLGIDVGTSGLKVAVVSEHGDALAESVVEYTVDSPRPGWAETDATVWAGALRTALSTVSRAFGGRRLIAAGIAGQMHSTVVCDAAGNALRPAILWPDRRAESEVELWRRLPEPVRARLANPLVAGMTGPTLRWLIDHDRNVASRAEIVLLAKDYLRVALGGPPVTDRSDASATLLWDVIGDEWSRATLAWTGLPGRLLPRVVDSDAVVGETSLFGSLDGPGRVPLVVGCADTAAAMLAVGRLTGDAIQVNLGTGAQVLRPMPRATANADPRIHQYADAGTGWYAMAAIQNAGLAVEWVRTLFGLSWSDLFAAAAGASPGANGVSFLPFLTGERGGIALPNSRGAWVGMSVTTDRGDLIRAAVEAIAFCVRRAVELLDAEGLRIRLTGGGGRSHIPRLLADVLGVPVQRAGVRSASAVGAAVLAARGVGARVEPSAATAAEIAPQPSAALNDAYRTWVERIGSE